MRPRFQTAGATRILVGLLLLIIGLSGAIVSPSSANADEVEISVSVTVRSCIGSLAGLADFDLIVASCPNPVVGTSISMGFRETGRDVRKDFNATTGGDGTTFFPTQKAMGEVLVFTKNSVDGFPANLVSASSTDDAGNTISGLGFMDFGTTTTSVVFQPTQPHEHVAMSIFLYDPNAAPANGGGTNQPDTSGIFVNTFSCGSADMTSVNDPTGLTSSCPDAVAGQLVILTQINGPSSQNTTRADGSSFFSAGIGNYTITSAIPVPFTSAKTVCTEKDPNGTPITTQVLEATSSGTSSAALLTDGNFLHCTFFYYESPNGTGNAGPPGIGGTALLCDADLQGMSAGQLTNDVVAASCPLLGSGVRLTLTFPNGTNQQVTSGDDGSYFFGPLDGGTYQLTADAPATHDGLTALCQIITATTSNLEAFVDQGTGTVSIPKADANVVLKCRLLLYNPDGNAPGTVTTPSDKAGINITARSCPDGFMSSNFDQLDATCGDATGPVSFSISGPTTETKATTGGSVDFAELTPGTWTITEETPDGFGQAVVICAKNESAGGFGENEALPVVSGNSVTTEVPAGINMRCSWFNTTEPVIDGTVEGTGGGGNGSGTGSNANTDTATLIIVLKTCPEDYNPDTVNADPEKECTKLTDNVNISATSKDNKKKRRQTGETRTRHIDLRRPEVRHLPVASGLSKGCPQGVCARMRERQA